MDKREMEWVSVVDCTLYPIMAGDHSLHRDDLRK